MQVAHNSSGKLTPPESCANGQKSRKTDISLYINAFHLFNETGTHKAQHRVIALFLSHQNNPMNRHFFALVGAALVATGVSTSAYAISITTVDSSGSPAIVACPPFSYSPETTTTEISSVGVAGGAPGVAGGVPGVAGGIPGKPGVPGGVTGPSGLVDDGTIVPPTVDDSDLSASGRGLFTALAAVPVPDTGSTALLVGAALLALGTGTAARRKDS